MIDFIVPIVITLLLLALFVFARLVTTLFHELGHGMPAIIFTREKVEVFLGSYGDVEKSRHLAVGKKLNIYFKLNPLKWTRGMAQNTGNNLTTFKGLIILSLGPLCSLFLALAAIWTIYSFDLNWFLKLFSIIFFVSALFDLRNLYPDDTPIELYDGTYSYRDGYQILRLIKHSRAKKRIAEAYEMFKVEDYDKAISLFERVDPDYIDRHIFFVIIITYYLNEDFEKAKKFYTPLLKRNDWQYFDANTFLYLGMIESETGSHDLAVDFYNKSIVLDDKNANSISNRGYTHILLERYEDAINDFNTVIEIEPESAYAFANKGYAKIKLGSTEEGLADINNAISLDNTNSYAYRNLGLYYFDNGNYQEAATNFQLAYNLDPNTHLIEEFQKMASDKLNVTA